jgi:hypothetical protein
MNRLFKIALIMLVACLILCVVQLARSPEQIVRQYILALKEKDYRVAYSYLTPDTQKMLSFEAFSSLNEKMMTGMNERKTWISWQGVMVGAQIYEDPGTWGYLLVKSNGKWRIVLRKGSPSFPYVKDYFCGNDNCEY